MTMKRSISTIITAAGILAGFLSVHILGCSKQQSTETPANPPSVDNTAQSAQNETSEPDSPKLTPELREIQDGVIQRNQPQEEPAPCIYGPPEMLNPPKTEEDTPKDQDEVEPYKEIRNEDPGMVRALYGVVTPNVTKKWLTVLVSVLKASTPMDVRIPSDVHARVTQW